MLDNKFYPLSSTQDLILLQQKFSLDKSISNINIMAHFEGEINDELMHQAISMALLRNRSASFQIRKVEKNKYEQHYASAKPQPIEIVDFRGSPDNKLNSYLKKEGTQTFPNKCFDVPLYKVKYIVKPDGKRGIYFVVNHMIFDAFSLMFMAEDALNIYEALIEGKPLPKPFRNAESLFDKEREYLESADYKIDFEFWEELFEDEPMYSSLHPAGSKDYNPNKRTGKAAIFGLKTKSKSWIGKIPAGLVEKTAKFAAEHGVTMQSLYLLPIRNAHSRANNYSEDIMFSNIMAQRSTLLEKQAGGTRASNINIRMRFGNHLTFLEAAKEMTGLFTSYFKHSRCPYLPVSNMIRKRFNLSFGEGYASTAVTFQPYALKKRENLPIYLEYISNGQTARALYVNFMYLDSSGDLFGIYEYNLSRYKTPELIEKLHNHLVISLSYAMEYPEVTLRELMEKF